MDKLKEKKAGQEISANQVGSKEQKSTTTQEKAKEKEGGKYGGLKNHTALLGKRRVCHYTDKRKIWGQWHFSH